MTILIDAKEAARRLGVRRETLYAYVSRGVIARRVGPDGRRSLFELDEVDKLAAARRAPRLPTPSSIDVELVTAVTRLDDDGPRYRGYSVTDLARGCSFEQVAELLWSGDLPSGDVHWPVPDAALVAHLRARRHLAGFGHRIYRGDDPRVTPLLELLDDVDQGGGGAETVRELLTLASALVVQRPNVDFALGALAVLAGWDDAALEAVFVVARMAGWLAHAAEEYGERPIRYRALARYPADESRREFAKPM